MEFLVGTLEQAFNASHTQREARGPLMYASKGRGLWRAQEAKISFHAGCGNMQRIDQAPKLRKMMRPPLVRVRYFGTIDCTQRFRLITPPAPVAVKRIHATGHVDSRINKCGSGESVFFIKLKRGHHNSR
jgi:hypothetical protein